MARKIYKVKLNPCLYACKTQEEVYEMTYNGLDIKQDLANCTTCEVVVSEEHTVKMFMFCRTLQKLEKFEWNEIFAALVGLAQELGYDRNAKDIADQVQTWCERMEYLDDEEFTEWIID